jgi:hypothetical protein
VSVSPSSKHLVGDVSSHNTAQDTAEQRSAQDLNDENVDHANCTGYNTSTNNGHTIW